ncbi:MAG: type II toxin-antitoxin system RelE/ParE family toxin [Bacteroidetes bacterium]|nr:type II toxin-antitoxin system RelE/ParE family toxin [Bacteroidota bacterium]
MVEINWTAEAEQRLKEIYEYIAIDNPNAAKEVINGIYKKVQTLHVHPEIGYKYQMQNQNNIRILLYGHYRIAYIIYNDKSIDILGIFHGSMNIDTYLI